MSSAEDSGSKCSSGPISSFTIQSILGTPSDAPRSGTKELSKGPPPPRRRSLSVSSEEECSGGEDSADCFCSDTGHSEPCSQHQNFSCLGKTIIIIIIIIIIENGTKPYFFFPPITQILIFFIYSADCLARSLPVFWPPAFCFCLHFSSHFISSCL